jgi:hypothetical protein
VGSQHPAPGPMLISGGGGLKSPMMVGSVSGDGYTTRPTCTIRSRHRTNGTMFEPLPKKRLRRPNPSD